MGQHIARIVYPGILPSGEQFNYSMWWAWAAGTDMDVPTAKGIGDAWNTSLAVAGPFRALYATGTTFAACKPSVVDSASGVTLQVGTGGNQFTGSTVGTSLPPQVALCITLRTARAGTSYRGRFYLPAPVVGDETTNGRISGSDITSILTALKNAGTAVRSVYSGVIPVVYSRTHRTFEPVTFLDMGDVYDTQRRRRDKLAEVRQTALPY